MHVKLKNVGPITEAEADLGDLTVLVGPQASGKSVFLQTLKLAMDRDFVLHYFRRHNFVFPKLGRKNDPEIVLDAFYGDGMGGILKKNSTITFENYQDFPLQDLTHSKRTRKIPDERIFYIPEQRSIALYFGYFQPFCNFHFNNPFVLRYFSEKIDEFIRNEFESNLDPFPDNDRSTGPLNRLISKRFLGEAKLRVEPDDHAKALGLEIEGLSRQLPFLAWSAGQREFVPLLLGLHWLCPAGRVSRRNNLEWVVIEEPEMGLHPCAIAAFLVLVLELMNRGYRVLISTHSTVILDLIWAMRWIIEKNGNISDVLHLLDLPSNPKTNELAEHALQKIYKVYYLDCGKEMQDISTLDPGSDDEAVSHWGGLEGFSSRSADVVADVVARSEIGTATK